MLVDRVYHLVQEAFFLQLVRRVFFMQWQCRSRSGKGWKRIERQGGESLFVLANFAKTRERDVLRGQKACFSRLVFREISLS